MKLKIINLLTYTIFSGLLIGFAHAQCGVTMSCGTPGVCDVHACFLNAAAKKEYEQTHNCLFPPGDLCGTQSLDKTTQCCIKDAKTGDSKIRDKQLTKVDPNFDWKTYKLECKNMHQSTAPPDSLWRQCKFGERHDPNLDEWPILVVQQNLSNPSARSYCIDGCSTPFSAVETLYALGIFLVKDKDNPTGYPGASFVGACSAHDVCYQTCSASSAYEQDSCDNVLLRQSIEACNVIPRNLTFIDAVSGIRRHTYNACVNAANKMNTGLYIGGKSAFQLRKQQYCQCC